MSEDLRYEQRIIIKFLLKEGLDPDHIVAKLNQHYREHAYKPRTVYAWIGEITRGRKDLHDAIRSGRPILDDVDAAIIGLLNKNPFESARSIAERLSIAPSTVTHHLEENLGYHSFHLRWVPHVMTEDLKAKRKEVANQMLPYLEKAASQNWRRIVTGDESWFYLSQLPSRMWSLARDNVATNVRNDFQSQKIMFTIMWNPHRFYVVNRLPENTTMNSTYYTSNILQPLYDCFFPGGHVGQTRKLVIHVDNCSIHKSAQAEQFMANHKMVRMPHPPYSPDLAPSDFYLFGRIKNQLKQIVPTITDNSSER
jgi:hypothetical protein